MKSFALREGVGNSAVREIGRVLRAYGTGTHWIERYRGQTFINVGDEKDEAILATTFSDLVMPSDTQNR